MSKKTKLTPPAWCPDAIATPRGWETEGGELLKAHKGLAEAKSGGKKKMQTLNEAPTPKPMDEMEDEELDAIVEDEDLDEE